MGTALANVGYHVITVQSLVKHHQHIVGDRTQQTPTRFAFIKKIRPKSGIKDDMSATFTQESPLHWDYEQVVRDFLGWKRT